jgi:HemY protein
MIRLLGILLGAGAVAAIVAWIADRRGELVFTLDSYEIHMIAPVAIGLAVVFTVLVIVLARLITALITGPGAIGAWFNARRIRRGNDSLSRGLIAVASGDVAEARRNADRARGILGSHPLALLLHAQTASLDGDGSAQRHAYRAMLSHEDTELLGLRGLFTLAARENQHDQALAFASRAHALKPRAPWAANALFDLRAGRGEWSKARAVLEGAARAKLLDNDIIRRRRAVLLAAEAIDADRHGESDKALQLATDALALAPGLAPAAVLAARRLAAAGKTWRAQGVVEACWSQSPHPDLAEVYASIKLDESYEQRAKRLAGLAHLNRDHFESRVLEAEEAVQLKNWSEARRLLAPIAHASASARVCALMAEIEEGENADATAAHVWLSRAARASRDAEWRCSNCGATQADWWPVCNACGSFDSFTWFAAMTPTAGTTDFQTVASSALSTPNQTHESNVIKVPVNRAGLVTLPRPPDDPGPGGVDF